MVPVLLLDAGNIFAGGPLPEGTLEPMGRKAELLLKAMDRMGYEAAALGEMDLYLGLEKLRALDELTDVRFLSANLTDTGGNTLFKPYLMLKTGTLKVLVLGLTRPPVRSSLLAERMGGNIIQDPLETAGRMVPRLREDCDLLVVLSNLGYRDDLQLAREVDGIDIIIGGRDRRFMKNPKIVNSTLVTSGYFQGRAIGKLVVTYNGPVQGWVSEKELRFMDSKMKAAGERASSERDQEKFNEIRDRREAAGRLTRYHNDMVNLDPSIPDAADVASMIREYREKRP